MFRHSARALVLLLASLPMLGQGTTPNLNLNTPAVHSLNWGPAINANFTILDGYLSGGSALPSNFWTYGGNNNPCRASGGAHAAGFVPDPGATTGTTRYLREDCTWAVPATQASSYFTGTPTVAVTAVPSSGSVLVATSSSAASFRHLTPADIAPAFSASLACGSISCGNLEAGVTTTNPATFTASYANPTLPTSATLSDGVNAAVTLSSPFTSGSLPHAYCTVGQGLTSWTFTLNAVDSVSGQATSANQGVNCVALEFGGVGTAGATGATASGSNAVLVGATGTLASAGLGQQSSWGAYNPTNQYIYILGTGSSCTFTSGGFNFLMNAPISFTFTNQNATGVTMQLYRSVNPQSAPTTLIGSC